MLKSHLSGNLTFDLVIDTLSILIGYLGRQKASSETFITDPSPLDQFPFL